MKKSDSVFYSIPENHLKIRLLKRLQLLKKYRIICFINDLNAFRYDGQNDGDPGEVRALAAADKILAPNVNTVSMLKKNVISSDMIPVGIWDYRMNETQIAKIREISHAHKKENAVKIAFAGNLNKSEFLSAMEIPSDVRMELWGKLDPEREKTLAEGCHYHGILSSDEIPFAVGEMDYGMAVERMRSKAAWANTFDIITHTNVHYTLRPAFRSLYGAGREWQILSGNMPAVLRLTALAIWIRQFIRQIMKNSKKQPLRLHRNCGKAII